MHSTLGTATTLLFFPPCYLPKPNKTGFGNFLLAFSPLENDWHLDVNEHINFVEFVVSVFGKDTANDVALVGDNLSSKKAITTKLNVCLVGFHSNRFNLAVTDILSIQNDLPFTVCLIMKQLRHIVSAAKPRRLTSLKWKVDNVTRWS